MNVKQIFLKQLEDFIDEMCTIFPEVKKLQVFKTQYEMMKAMNSTIIIENFYTYVIPHKDKILNEDEDFFINGGGQENVSGDLIKFRDLMTDIWMNKMTPENKVIAWKYFKVFVVLSQKYNDEKTRS